MLQTASCEYELSLVAKLHFRFDPAGVFKTI
jgi:hypothetical protein